MNEMLVAILKALMLIHDENILIMTILTDKDVDDKLFKPLQENFDSIIESVKKKER